MANLQGDKSVWWAHRSIWGEVALFQGWTSEGKGLQISPTGLTKKRLWDYPRGSHLCQRKSVKSQCHLNDSNGHHIIIPPTKWKNLDAPMICCSSIPRDKQMRLGKTNYFPTTPRLASVRVHRYQCLDKKAWNGIRHWSEEEVVMQNLCYCAILLFSYRKSSVVSYIPYHMLAIFMLLWLLISHVFCSTCVSLNWDMMLVLFKITTRDRAYIKHADDNHTWLPQAEREKKFKRWEWPQI